MLTTMMMMIEVIIMMLLIMVRVHIVILKYLNRALKQALSRRTAYARQS